MGDGLATGAGRIDVGGAVGGEDAEGGGGEAFRRYVDVRGRERGASGEEEGLCEGLRMSAETLVERLKGLWEGVGG